MRPTYVFPIEDFINYLRNSKEIDGYTHVVLGFGLHGEAYIPTKKVPFYRIPTIIRKEAFKEEMLANIDGTGRVPACLVFIHKDKVDTLAEIDGEHAVKLQEKRR